MMSDEAPTLADFGKFMERKSRPDHVGVPRKRMELTFSVQLMRQSYAVVDDLDFVPMDEFQKDFFLFRQDEWEDYKGYHPTVMQGDLADPLYFDFIRYSFICVDAPHLWEHISHMEMKFFSLSISCILHNFPSFPPSFAQYVVIGDKMRKGQQEFVERNGAEGNATIIRRDPLYTDNSLLPEVHTTILGDRIIE